MGQILHGSATTTHAIRAAIQRSKATAKALAERHGINPKTVAKWKKRAFVHDAPMGLKTRARRSCRSRRRPSRSPSASIRCCRSTIASMPCRPPSRISPAHRFIAAISATTSAGCRKWKAISLPRRLSKKYPIGYFHVDIAEVRTEEGKLYLFVAVDRISKFAFAQLHDKAGKLVAAEFLRDLIDAVPYKIHTVLTDNGIQFVNRKRDNNALEHIFGRTCRESSIEHRLTKIKHPWTNGQALPR